MYGCTLICYMYTIVLPKATRNKDLYNGMFPQPRTPTFIKQSNS